MKTITIIADIIVMGFCVWGFCVNIKPLMTERRNRLKKRDEEKRNGKSNDHSVE